MDAAGDALSESLGAVAPELLAQLAAEKRGGRPEFLRLTILHKQRRSNLSLRQRSYTSADSRFPALFPVLLVQILLQTS